MWPFEIFGILLFLMMCGCVYEDIEVEIIQEGEIIEFFFTKKMLPRNPLNWIL